MSDYKFQNLKVYALAREIFIDILNASNKIPRNMYFLRDQLLRAWLSVILNIAEGSGKDSDKEFKRYIQNSLGSLNESVACLDIVGNLGYFESKDLYEKILKLKISLGSLSKYLKESK